MADSSTVSESNLTAEARGGVQKAQKFAKKAKKREDKQQRSQCNIDVLCFLMQNIVSLSHRGEKTMVLVLHCHKCYFYDDVCRMPHLLGKIQLTNYHKVWSSILQEMP